MVGLDSTIYDSVVPYKVKYTCSCTDWGHGCELLMSEDLVKLFVYPPVVGLGPRGQQKLEGHRQTRR